MSSPRTYGSSEAGYFNDPPQRTVGEVQALLQEAERSIVIRFDNRNPPLPQLAKALRENNQAAETLLNNAFGEESPQEILEDAVKKEASLLQDWNLTRFGTGDWDSEEGLHDVFYHDKKFPLRQAAKEANYIVAGRETLRYSWYGLPPLEFELVRKHYYQRKLGNEQTGHKPGLFLREALHAMGLTWPPPAPVSALAPVPTSTIAPASTSHIAPAPTSAFRPTPRPTLGPTPRPTLGPTPGRAQGRAQGRVQGPVQTTQPTNAPAPDPGARAKGYTHEAFKHAPSPNVPMPKGTPPAHPVNFTIAEIMTFFPQTVRSMDMTSRISWNGGNPTKVTNMYLSHRLEGDNVRTQLKNSILKMFTNSQRTGPENPSGWKQETYTQGENRPNTHNPNSISMDGIRTFAESNSRFGDNPKYPATRITFGRLLEGVKHLPSGHDALDLTRCVEYVTNNWAQYSTLFFPDDYFTLLTAVGGPMNPTNQHYDRAAFGRWNYERTDATWNSECTTFRDKMKQLSGSGAPAQNLVPNPIPGSNVPPPQTHIQQAAPNIVTAPYMPNQGPHLIDPQRDPWAQQHVGQNLFGTAPNPPGLQHGPSALPHQYPSTPQASQYGYPQNFPYEIPQLPQDDYQEQLQIWDQQQPQNNYQHPQDDYLQLFYDDNQQQPQNDYQQSFYDGNEQQLQNNYQQPFYDGSQQQPQNDYQQPFDDGSQHYPGYRPAAPE